MKSIATFIWMAVSGFAIGLAVAFVLDGFVWNGLRHNFGTGLAAMVAGLLSHYYSKRKKT